MTECREMVLSVPAQKISSPISDWYGIGLKVMLVEAYLMRAVSIWLTSV